MKKIIMAFSAACLLIGAASCDKTATAKSEAGDGFVDSLSSTSGRLNGAMFAKNIVTLPEADQKKFNKDAFLKGLKAVYLTDTADLGYIIGMQIGMNMLQQQRMMDQNGVPTDRNLFYKAFAEAFKADSVPEAELTELQGIMTGLQTKAQTIMNAKQQEQQMAQMKAMEEKNKEGMEAGKAYIAKQKEADKAIQTTESGLSYKVIKEGQGPKVTDNDRVKVKYTGKLIDGTVFDSNDSTTFSPRGVVPGFSEGLKMMNKGSKMTLYIPGDLGYGAHGMGDKIAPGAMLVFDVEVLDVTPAKK